MDSATMAHIFDRFYQAIPHASKDRDWGSRSASASQSFTVAPSTCRARLGRVLSSRCDCRFVLPRRGRDERRARAHRRETRTPDAQEQSPPRHTRAPHAAGVCGGACGSRHLRLMVWVFLFDNKGNPLSYVAYAVSAYLFTILVIWVVRDVPAQRAIAFARRNPHVSRLMDDEDMRRRLFVFIGVVVDVLWALGEPGAGDRMAFRVVHNTGHLLPRIRSDARCPALRVAQERRVHDERTARVSRICGIMLIASVLVLSGIVTLIMIGEGPSATIKSP